MLFVEYVCVVVVVVAVAELETSFMISSDF